ncbi:alpha/beta hydrolase [Flagellimonas lutimaris]|uniref:alpha/beta hydrolase n=1 Tax=Flagellimonas lutimaris TaxID=475082 RepID=UPI003F5CDB69
MKERLIIISDLWGREKSEWLINYTRILKSKFNIEFYDSCELGQIDISNYNQENLHKQFISGGIEIAVDKLIEREKHKVNILAFSIGGTIAWNFGLKSDNINSLVWVSSTRLRNETETPEGNLKLYFGENDDYKPTVEWFENMNLEYEFLSNKGHEVYCEPQFAEQLSKKIIKTTPQ